MPGAHERGYELRHAAVAIDEHVRGYPRVGDGSKIRVCGRIEAVQKKALDIPAAEFRRRQADRMDDDQIDRAVRGSDVEIR